MTKEEKKKMWLTTWICLLPMIAGFLVYDQLPEMVATHFDGNWEPNDYSPKFFAAYGLPLIMGAFNLFVHGCLSLDPKKDAPAVAIKNISFWICPVLSVFCSVSILGYALGYPIGVQRITPFLLGILLVVIGNYLPKCRQNHTVGIKLPWTLRSENNWNFTHRHCGYIWMIVGALWIVVSFMTKGTFTDKSGILLVVMGVSPFVLSFGYYVIKEKKN